MSEAQADRDAEVPDLLAALQRSVTAAKESSAARDAGQVRLSVRAVLADHFVMWQQGEGLPCGEWRCACGEKFGFSDSAIDHQAEMIAPLAARQSDPDATNRDALIHARWHRALDDISTEPDGPIKDHLAAHRRRLQAEALREAADEYPNQIGAALRDRANRIEADR